MYPIIWLLFFVWAAVSELSLHYFFPLSLSLSLTQSQLGKRWQRWMGSAGVEQDHGGAGEARGCSPYTSPSIASLVRQEAEEGGWPPVTTLHRSGRHPPPPERKCKSYGQSYMTGAISKDLFKASLLLGLSQVYFFRRFIHLIGTVGLIYIHQLWASATHEACFWGCNILCNPPVKHTFVTMHIWLFERIDFD